MKIKEISGKLAYGTIKEIATFVAPLTALSSTAATNGKDYLDHFVATYHVPEQVYQIGKAFAKNEGIRDFTFKRLNDLATIVSNATKNIVENPVETAVAAGIVYCLTRFSPYIIKGAVNIARKKK